MEIMTDIKVMGLSRIDRKLLWCLLVIFAVISVVVDKFYYLDNQEDGWFFLIRAFLSVLFCIVIVKTSTSRWRDFVIVVSILAISQWTLLTLLVFFGFWTFTGFAP